jgi:hypothetical protein
VFTEVRDVRGNLVYDAYTAILMREHGIREIYTGDTDFHCFPFLHVAAPWREPVGPSADVRVVDACRGGPSLPGLRAPGPPSGRG